ncbi:hypothetical protein H7X87_03625 [Acetobacteraceae bacterium]|nr:hypothetical protein [Candidatus Parcubacteria bacterium]
MRKNRTHNPYRRAYAKGTGTIAAREFTAFLLSLLEEKKELSDELFDSRKQKTRKMWEMRRLGYITKENKLTNKGRYAISEEKIWSLTIPRPARWDGKWRMVLFDIPAKKARQRHSFRTRLKELGLVLYQNSVWVYPYPLEKTTRAISDFYMISDCVLFVVAQEINNESQLKRRFQLD